MVAHVSKRILLVIATPSFLEAIGAQIYFSSDGSYTDIGEDFNPEVGFVQRTGVRRFRGEASYTPWPDKFGIREIQIGPEIDLVLTQENELETQDITFDTQFEFETGDDIGFQIQNTMENLRQGFILEGEEIPFGDYNLYFVSGIGSNQRCPDDWCTSASRVW